MATTYFANVQPNFSANYNLFSILNTDASLIVKIRRVRFLNHQVGAVTGQVAFGELKLYTGAGISGSTGLTVVKADSNSGALDGDITVAYGGTLTGTATTLRRYIWSTDEAISSALTVDEYQSIDMLQAIWDVGYGDSSVQKLTLRQNQMFSIYNLAGATGAVSIFVSFTVE